MDPLSDILSTFRLNVDIIHNAQYCGEWALDTSGQGYVCFHLVTRGSCYARADCMEGPVKLEQGDLIVFPNDAAHVLEAEPECHVVINTATSLDYDSVENEAEGAGLLCGYFQFSNPASNPLLGALPSVMVKRHSDASGELTNSLLSIIAEEAVRQGSGTQAALNRLTESLFILLLREQLAQIDQNRGLAAALQDARISKALVAMHADCEYHWKVEELAEAASMSRSAFAELFKSLLGETPVAYLSQLRMQKAWVWLSEEGASVYSAAVRAGYETEASFSKAFKKVVGVSPGSVRKKAA
ncbi:MAG: AraC family transcriptional regulator [Pseudomonadales bacterium]